MDDRRTGLVLRALRRRRRLRQADVAARAGVSQQTVSQVELGRLGSVELGTARRVAAALDASLEIAPRWRGPELDRLLDARHAEIVEQVAGELRRRGWAVRLEATFSRYGERGSIDVLGWHPRRRALAVVEVESRVVDLQDLLSTIDRKARLAPVIARSELGWSVDIVGRILVVGESMAARRLVAGHRATFDIALPARSHAVRRWLLDPASDLGGIWFLSSTSVAGVGGRLRRRDRPMTRLPRSA